ncbi:MAG: Transcription elongation factor NusA-like protein [Promethearchaeota archaeon]|nr:MAG: Transcription elongation factor NusA-like protein [Candidatus Lokiarchaeota archaeon]
MKFLPACETCVKSGFLCVKCQEKLDEGDITPFELDLAKDLIEMEQKEKYGYLENVSFFKAIDYEDVVILVVGKGDKIRIGQDLINWIKDIYEIDKIILVEKTDKPRSALESLIAPGKLISLNEIFLATGDVEFRAVIRKADKSKILFTRQELEELVKELTGQSIRVEFI